MTPPPSTPAGRAEGWVRGPRAPRPVPPPSTSEGGPSATVEGATARPTTPAARNADPPVRTGLPGHPRTSPASTGQADRAGRKTTRAAGEHTLGPQDRQLAAPGPLGPARSSPRHPGTGSSEEVGWVKAHGGAGVTSLVEVLGGVDVGAAWPDPSRGQPRRIVLVGRTSARGLQSISRALGAFDAGRAPQGLDLLAVVLVADAPGRLPLGLLRRIRVLRSAARVHRVPWIPAWRVGSTPKALPRQFDRLAELVGSGIYSNGTVS